MDYPAGYYRPSYFRAVRYLIDVGVVRDVSAETVAAGRALIALALRELRASSRARAQRERRHLRFICGCFPGEV
jgi:hypothetical protein